MHKSEWRHESLKVLNFQISKIAMEVKFQKKEEELQRLVDMVNF